MSGLRTAVRLFGLANPAYADATVTFYQVDQTTGTRRDALVALYDAPAGNGLLPNPLTLDSAGKLPWPAYLDEPAIAVVQTGELGSHATGIIPVAFGRWRGDWQTGLTYSAGDYVRDGDGGDGTGNVFVCVGDHVAAGWTVDQVRWNRIFDIEAATSAPAEAEAWAGAAAASADAAAEDAGAAATAAANAAQDASDAAGARVDAQAARDTATAARDQAEVYRDEAQAAVGGVLVSDTDTTAGKLVDKLRRHDGGAPAIANGGGNEAVWLTADAVHALGQGWHDIAIQPGALVPHDVNGADDGSHSSASGHPWSSLDFDPVTTELAATNLPMPANVGSSAPHIAILAMAASGSGDVAWSITAAWIRPGTDGGDPAFGTTAIVVQSLTADPFRTDFVEVVPGGVFAAGSVLAIKISRAASDGSDTLAADACLLGLILRLAVDGETAA